MKRQLRSEYTTLLKTISQSLIQTVSQRRIRKDAAVLLCAVAMLFLSSCGEDNKKAAKLAADSGLKAMAHNDLDGAKSYFQYALKKNPLSANANFGMARLNDLFYQDNSNAVVYYRRYLDLIHYGDFYNETKNALKILDELNSGKLEDPVRAFQDFVLLVDSDQSKQLVKRLNIAFIAREAQAGKNLQKVFQEFEALFLDRRIVIAKRRFTKEDKEAVLLVGLAKGNHLSPENRKIFSSADGLKDVNDYYAFELVRSDEENHGLWQLMSYSKLGKSE